MILQRSTSPKYHCAVIFAVLDLRVGGCRPYRAL